MARGRQPGVYHANTPGASDFYMQVEKNRFADAAFGWGTGTSTNIYQTKPQSFRPRGVYGVSPTSGRRAFAIVPSITADVWTGAATTFAAETDDPGGGGTDTYTIVSKKQEFDRQFVGP